MAQSLAQLNGRLDSVTQAITSATKQAERNAEASGKLAESLNRFTQLLVIATFCLVFVGIAQIVVAIVHH